MERYRSGHNGTVLKTVDGQPSVGSNPTLSAGATEASGVAAERVSEHNKNFSVCGSTQEAEGAPLLRE